MLFNVDAICLLFAAFCILLSLYFGTHPFPIESSTMFDSKFEVDSVLSVGIV